MAFDIELAINLIQAKHRALTGFPTLYAPNLDAYPTVLDTPNLPCLLTWPADGAWFQKGHGYKVDERVFLVLGFVEPLGQNDIPSRAVAAVQLLQSVRAMWVTPANIPLDSGASSGYQITVESSSENRHSDQGITPDLAFGGKAYYGFRLRLNTRILWSIT